MSDSSTGLGSGRPPLHQRVPKPLWAAVVVGLVGFVVSISFSQRRVDGGRLVECSYVDVAAFVWAALVVGLVVAGVLAERAKTYDRLKLPGAFLAGLVVVLLALAVVHVLRGFGTVGGTCS